jgi:hypothetical protein
VKRIIDGTTYNIDTATQIAEGSWEDENRGIAVERTLYLTRGGVYFSVADITQTYHRDGEWQTKEFQEWTVVGDTAAARAHCEKEDLTILRDIEDLAPDEDEPEATYYIRLPRALKDACDARAKAEGISGNAFAMRCLEQCLQRAAHS